MAKPIPTTPPDSGKVLLAFLDAGKSFAASPVFARFEEAVQALDAAIAAEEALSAAGIGGDVTGALGCDAQRQVVAVCTAFEAVTNAPQVLDGDDKMGSAAGLINIVLSLSDPDARCKALAIALETLPFLKVKSRQPQAREVDRMVRLAFERLERLEELMFNTSSRGSGCFLI